ncbi:MAG TPA: BON domain-containing protein [Myxococcota bacterium]
MRNMLDNGDPVSTGDNGGFGYTHKSVEVVHPKLNDVQFGADALPERALVDTVRARLNGDLSLGVDAHTIVVGREGRGIILSGTVSSKEAKELAEIVARGTPGVTDVYNELLTDDDG